jgi:copper chaperone CopZ
MTLEKIQTIKVEGMSCPHCEANIVRNLSKLDGIEEVTADRITAQVKISGSHIDLNEIEQIVTDLGYQYKGEVQ